ncbi:response regulator transcription factor [Hamadaea tsunoensis]|uniref:response regulator transcription factor n=1 Tax=Hamadaea tsunoensis TaxID=53368 RepID=UPI000687B157|nr:helix-turn-helix transcriptional regulator [Hamadaea tsunoensis]
MVTRTPSAARVLSRFAGALDEDRNVVETIDVAAEALLSAVPADVWCAVVLDPSTLLDTGGVHRAGFPAEVMPRLFEIEHAEQDDVDNLRALTRRTAPVSLLSRSTGGDLATSKYYREILAPLRLADELRVLLRDGEHTWGLLVLCRSAGSPAFSDAELSVAAEVSRPVTVAARRSLLLTGVDDGLVDDAPGVVMLAADGTLLSVSPTAGAWLDQLGEVRTGGLPHPVRAVVAAAHAAPDASAWSRVRTPAGTWATIRAWRMSGPAGGGTVISVGPAEPGELTAIVLDAYGLTPRERDVTQLVLLGRSGAQIGDRLGLSVYTVQDHLKSVFDKTGVRSRRDLVSHLFTRHYLPQLQQPSLSLDGRRHPAPE